MPKQPLKHTYDKILIDKISEEKRDPYNTQNKKHRSKNYIYKHIPRPTALGHEYKNVLAGCAIFSNLS